MRTQVPHRKDRPSLFRPSSSGIPSSSAPPSPRASAPPPAAPDTSRRRPSPPPAPPRQLHQLFILPRRDTASSHRSMPVYATQPAALIAHPARSTLDRMPRSLPRVPRSTLLTILAALGRLLRQLHPLHAPAARRRRLRPRRGRPRDAPPPRLRHALRQRHPLPRKGAAPLLVDGRLMLPNSSASPRRRSRAHPALPHRPRPRAPLEAFARRAFRSRPRRPLRRAHPALQLRHLHLHPHQHPRRDGLPLAHPRPLRLLAHRRNLASSSPLQTAPSIAATQEQTPSRWGDDSAEAFAACLRPQRPHQGPHRHRLPHRHRPRSTCSSPAARAPPSPASANSTRSPRTAVFLAIAAPWHILIAPRQPHPRAIPAASPSPRPLASPLPTDGNVHGWFWFYFVNEQLLRYLNLRVPRDYDTVPLWLFWASASSGSIPLRIGRWRLSYATTLIQQQRDSCSLDLRPVILLFFFPSPRARSTTSFPRFPPSPSSWSPASSSRRRIVPGPTV
jgi:hypothetical protein